MHEVKPTKRINEVMLGPTKRKVKPTKSCLGPQREKIGPPIGPKIRKPKHGPNLTCLTFCFTKVGWEYLHWIDLGLSKLMEAVVFNIHPIKIHLLQTLTFFETQRTPGNTHGNVQRSTTVFANRGTGHLNTGKSDGGTNLKMLGTS